jgi:hypothetical protein
MLVVCDHLRERLGNLEGQGSASRRVLGWKRLRDSRREDHAARSAPDIRYTLLIGFCIAWLDSLVRVPNQPVPQPRKAVSWT